MMILILRSSVVNKLTMTSYKELSLALTIEEPQKHRAPWLGALLSYMAEEVSAIQLFQLYPILEHNCLLSHYLYSFIVFTCVNSSQRLP